MKNFLRSLVFLLIFSASSVFGGAGTNLINQTFSTNPLWTDTGVGCSITGGEAVITFSTNAPHGCYKTFTTQTIAWMQFDLTFDSGHTALGGDEDIQGSGFTTGDVTPGVVVGIWRDFSPTNLRFRVVYQQESGEAVAINVGPNPIVADTTYDVLIRYETATTTTSNDGILKMWVDDVLYLDLTNVDNNGKTVSAFLAGTASNGPGLSFTLRIDKVKAGTTGSAPGASTFTSSIVN